ncbi:hypothetical protein AMTRI_Chr04g247070 [Amborella trichopoda]
MATENPENFRLNFLKMLRIRRRKEGIAIFMVSLPLTVELSKPVTNPRYQGAMESCPKRDGYVKIDFAEENLYLYTEEGEQGRLPVLILSLRERNQYRRPAVVSLHSSYKCKEWIRPLLEGYVAVSVDSRYHGERANSVTAYRDALVSALKNGDTMPFIYETEFLLFSCYVWDLIKLTDYLTERKDVDPSRIGITGESLGGMHAWVAAAADTRYAVGVPIIENGRWHARVESIKAVFKEARTDLYKSEIDSEIVEKVWDQIAPGVAHEFDAPHSILAITPRPLLILNGEEDPRCPVEGLQSAMERVVEAYYLAKSPGNFKFISEPGIGHEMTPLMVKEASNWFDKFLN